MQKFQLDSEKEFIRTLKTIVQAYEEVSVIRMQRIRSSVLAARKFLTDLSTVFMDVKTSYHDEIITLYAKHKKLAGTKEALLTKNNKEAVVLLSSNAKLYGDIVRRVFNGFVNYTLTKPSKDKKRDIVIIGRVGKEFYEQLEHKLEYTFFELPDFEITIDDLKSIAYFLATYEKVTVFHGRFDNVLTQQPVSTNVSGQEQNLQVGEQSKDRIHYFFEPSLENILHFFETQVFSLLLKQTIHEGELSRVASRLQAMETALSNIQKNEERLIILSRLVKKQIDSKKRIETFSGLALWRK
jgi:ATP synthase F1 gamma subunit